LEHLRVKNPIQHETAGLAHKIESIQIAWTTRCSAHKDAPVVIIIVVNPIVISVTSTSIQSFHCILDFSICGD
jgi:hypothetical protein